MDGPPSFTSAIQRNSDQQHSQVIQPYHNEENHYTPSMSDIRPLTDKSHPDLSIEDGSVLPRAMIQPTESYDADRQAVSIGAMAVREREIQRPDQLGDTSGYGEQAPSVGSMARDGGNSQTAGGNFDHNAPAPSYTDVASRGPSYTGELGGGLNLPDGNFEDVSLNGRDLAKHFSKIFQNGDDKFNPYR